MPTFQVPVLNWDGLEIPQSGAIARQNIIQTFSQFFVLFFTFRYSSIMLVVVAWWYRFAIPKPKAVFSHPQKQLDSVKQARHILKPQINYIPRWAKWIVSLIELNLLLPYVGLSALSTWPCPPARRFSTAVHKASPDMVIVVSILSEDALPALPPFLSMYCILFIYAGQYPTAPQARNTVHKISSSSPKH